MLLVHQAGSVKVGEVVRYAIHLSCFDMEVMKHIKQSLINIIQLHSDIYPFT